MKKLSKKLLSVLTAAAMIFTVLATPIGEILGFTGEAVKASAATWYSERITNSSDSRITAALNAISSQANVDTTIQSGKSVRDIFNFLLFESKYKIFGGATIPNNHCNKDADGGVSSNKFSEETVYGSKITMATTRRGCYWYAGYVSNIIYGKEGPWTTIMSSGGTISAEDLKTYVQNNLQAGEHIRMHSSKKGDTVHSIAYISCDANGFYYIDYSGTKNSTPKFNYTTYSFFSNVINTKQYGLAVYNANDNINSIDLTSAPSNLGTTFTAPIKVTTTGKVLTAGSDGNVTIANWTNDDSQKWTFTKNSSDNYYEIKNIKYGKCLDIDNAGNANDANVQVYTDNDTTAQRFGIYGSQGSYVIKPKYSTTHVVDAGGGNNNVHLWQYYSPTIDNQKFTIEADPNPAFSNVKASSITNDNAIISATAHKKPSTTALKFRIAVWPKDTGLVGSVTALMQLQTFAFDSTRPNQGGTTNTIEFNLKSEGTISEGKLMTLSPDTEYNYYITSYYNEGGVTVSYDSDTYTFKTTNTCSHTFGSWVTKTAATCTADGLKQRTCTKNCGKVESAVITKLGHSYTSSVTKAATCTATGVRTYKCSRCTSSYTESIAKTGHTYTTGYEAAHPHKNYKKCTVCSTVEYTGTTQYLYNCASCTNLTVPTITSVTSPANINKEVTIKWTASTSDKLGHYWVRILDPNGNVAVSKNLDTTVTSYTFTPTMTGEYTINVAATPTGSPDGTGSLWANKTVKVHDYVTYTIKSTYTSKGFDHHLCSQCSAEYKDNYTSGTKAIPSTPFTVTATSKSVKLSIPTTPFIEGYVITRKCNGVVDKETTVTDPAYYSFDITGFNTGRGANELIVYTRSGRYAETNTYGIEIVVDANGYVIGERAYGSEVKSIVPEGGFVASMHNASSQFADIAIGDRVEYDMADKILTVYYTAKTIENVTYTDTTTEPGKTYTYTVTPCVKEFKGATTEKSVTIAPSAVAGFKSPSQSTSAIRLNWTKNANADGYVIDQFDGTNWVQIADITDSATITYKVTGLKSGTAYKFRMKAYVNGTNGVVYGTKTATLTVNTMASSVSGLALKSRSASALRLTWTKNTAVDGYIIEQKIDGKWVQIADIDSYKTTEYKVTGLNASTKYSFRMKAYAITKYGDKTYSGYTSTLSKTTSPANVTGLKIGGRAGTALRLNWDKNTSADGYIIEQYKGGKWTQIADITDNATTTYRVTGLEASTQYKFRVKAYNMVGTTALYSNYTATLAAYTNPSAVSGLKIAGRAYSALRLSWTQNTTADGYIIEQYIDGKWTRIARIAGNETLSYRVENLTKATTYKFRVATYNIEDNVAYYGAYVTISGTTL